MRFEPAVAIEIIGAELTLGPIHTCAIDVIRKESGLAIRVSRFAETICWTSQLKKASGQLKENDGTLKYYLYLAA